MALAQTNYYQNAHRIDRAVAPSVGDVYPGQLFQFNAQDQLEVADGTKKAYPTLNSRYPGAGLGLQGERLEGRDDVSRTGKIAVFKGNFEIGTDMYDTSKTYTTGAALKATGGKATLWVSGTDSPALIIGYVTHVPTSAADMIRYEG